jgi:hypothetical protein
MGPVRRKLAVIGFAACALTGLLAQPVAALHAGAIVDCGSAGTFTIKTATTGAGLQPPGFFDVLVFEEHGTLTVLSLSINGQLRWDVAGVGMLHWNAAGATCSFTLANGDDVEVTGVLTGH